MKTQWTLLLIGGLSVAPAPASAQTTDLSPLVVHNVTGTCTFISPCPSPAGTSTGTSPSSGSGSTLPLRPGSTSEAATGAFCSTGAR